MNITEEHEVESCGHSNFSCLETSSTVADVLLYMCVAVVVTLTVCGNLLVIISICHFKQLQTPTNFLLFSLAMADFFVGVTVMPLYFTMLIDPERCFNRVFCVIFHVVSFYLTCVSIYNVALIAVDRCFAICNPFIYSMKITVNVTWMIISILWLFSFIYNMLFLYLNGNIPDIKDDITCVQCVVKMNETWSIVDFVIIFLVPCLTIVIMYMKIFSIAKNHASKIRSVQTCTKTNNASTKSERKAAKALGILVAVFLLCLVPAYTIAFLYVFVNIKYIDIAYISTSTAVFMNSAINPIIYALFYPWFQRSFQLILTGRIFSAGSSIMNVLAQETKQFPVR